MELFLHLLSACFFGAVTIGAFTWRTLAVYKGDVKSVITASFVAGFTALWSTSYIVEKDWWGYAAFNVGATAVTALMALKHRRKEKPDGDHSDRS